MIRPERRERRDGRQDVKISEFLDVVPRQYQRVEVRQVLFQVLTDPPANSNSC